MTSKKIEAYGCWNNERRIVISTHEAGLLYSLLFDTVEAAKMYYKEQCRSLEDDPIVKVTVEVIEE